MSFLLIRHGKTQGNLEGRYIGGRTDEPLCPSGCQQLQGKSVPDVAAVFSSPMKRCIQTAEILYPGRHIEIVEQFRECDFGEFENHNYAELNGRPDYQAWIDSGGEMAFPGGECRGEFAGRCVRSFEALTAGLDERKVYAFIVHGGTIMAIMEALAEPHGDYYDFQVRNGEGYLLYNDGRYEKWPV